MKIDLRNFIARLTKRSAQRAAPEKMAVDQPRAKVSARAGTRGRAHRPPPPPQPASNM